MKRRTKPDFSGVESFYFVESNVAARIEFSSRVVQTTDGTVQTTDAELIVGPRVDIRSRDVIEVLPDRLKKYSILTIDNRYSLSGRLLHKTASLILDDSK